MDESVHGDDDHSVDDLRLGVDLHSVVRPIEIVSFLLGSCIDVLGDLESSEVQCLGNADSSEHEDDLAGCGIDGDRGVHSDNDHPVDDLGFFGNRCSHVGPDVRVSVHLCLCIDILGNDKGSEFDGPSDCIGSVDEGDVSGGDGFFGVLCDEDHSVNDLGLVGDLDTVVLPHVCESGLRCSL